jgi:hypothetical protein
MAEDAVRKEFEQLADDNQLHGIARITCGNYFMEGYARGRSSMAQVAAPKSQELYDAWQAWLTHYGVPISEEFARLAEAIGEFTVEQRAAKLASSQPATPSVGWTNVKIEPPTIETFNESSPGVIRPEASFVVEPATPKENEHGD